MVTFLVAQAPADIHFHSRTITLSESFKSDIWCTTLPLNLLCRPEFHLGLTPGDVIVTHLEQ